MGHPGDDLYESVKLTEHGPPLGRNLLWVLVPAELEAEKHGAGPGQRADQRLQQRHVLVPGEEVQDLGGDDVVEPLPQPVQLGVGLQQVGRDHRRPHPPLVAEEVEAEGPQLLIQVCCDKLRRRVGVGGGDDALAAVPGDLAQVLAEAAAQIQDGRAGGAHALEQGRVDGLLGQVVVQEDPAADAGILVSGKGTFALWDIMSNVSP